MERVNLHHLLIFWTFAKSASFTKTAAELSIAQSAVTSQIRALEEALGLNLVNRARRRSPQITEEGRKVLEYADRIFESSRELMSWSKKGGALERAIVRIGAISGLSRNLQYEFMSPLLGKKNLRFEVSTGDQKSLLAKLSSHELDVVLTSHNVSLDRESHFFVHVLASTPVVFVCSKSTKTKRGESLEQKIRGLDLYIPGRTFEAKPELDGLLENLGARSRVAGEIEDVALLRIIAMRSGAVVAVPEMGVKTDLEQGDLRLISVARKIQQRYYAITGHRLNPSREVKALIEGLRGRSPGA